MDLVGRFYAAAASGREELASTSASMYTDDSVRGMPLAKSPAPAQACAAPLLAACFLLRSGICTTEYLCTGIKRSGTITHLFPCSCWLLLCPLLYTEGVSGSTPWERWPKAIPIFW